MYDVATIRPLRTRPDEYAVAIRGLPVTLGPAQRLLPFSQHAHTAAKGAARTTVPEL